MSFPMLFRQSIMVRAIECDEFQNSTGEIEGNWESFKQRFELDK